MKLFSLLLKKLLSFIGANNFKLSPIESLGEDSSVGDSLENSSFYNIRETSALGAISLPNIVSNDERIARVIHGGSSPKSTKKLYNPSTNKINPSRFMDNRNPRELSVNRISTLTTDQSHALGLTFVNDLNLKQSLAVTYHGYGELTVKTCLDVGCTGVIKDDVGGTKPYHANILYPEKERFEELDIANVLAFHAVLIKHRS
jgi:hypothetical protein